MRSEGGSPEASSMRREPRARRGAAATVRTIPTPALLPGTLRLTTRARMFQVPIRALEISRPSEGEMQRGRL